MTAFGLSEKLNFDELVKLKGKIKQKTKGIKKEEDKNGLPAA